jgi:hypothetical protein
VKRKGKEWVRKRGKEREIGKKSTRGRKLMNK